MDYALLRLLDTHDYQCAGQVDVYKYVNRI
jgi:hypothetical protein